MMDLRSIKGSKGQMNMVPAIVSVIVALIAISLAVIISNELITSQYSNFGINVSDPTDASSDVELQGGFNATRSLTGAGLTILPVVILILAALPVILAVFLLGYRT